MDEIFKRILDKLAGADLWIALGFLAAGYVCWRWLGTTARDKIGDRGQSLLGRLLSTLSGTRTWKCRTSESVNRKYPSAGPKSRLLSRGGRRWNVSHRVEDGQEATAPHSNCGAKRKSSYSDFGHSQPNVPRVKLRHAAWPRKRCSNEKCYSAFGHNQPNVAAVSTA
jgi:hypothetical protein